MTQNDINMNDILNEEVDINEHPTNEEIKQNVEREINRGDNVDEVQSTADEGLNQEADAKDVEIKPDATFVLAFNNLLKLYDASQQDILEQARLKHLEAYNSRPNYKKLFNVIASLPITQEMTREQAVAVVTDSLSGLRNMEDTTDNAVFLKELGQEMVVLVAISMNAVFKGDLNLNSLGNFMKFLKDLKGTIK